jgi:hypothetical protein
MGRVVRSISLNPELDRIVEKNVGDFSAYVQKCIERDFLNEDKIKAKIKEYEDKIKELKKIKMQQKPADTKEEKEFLKFVKGNLKQNPGEIHENLRVYNQKFGKRITIEKLKELIR